MRVVRGGGGTVPSISQRRRTMCATSLIHRLSLINIVCCLVFFFVPTPRSAAKAKEQGEPLRKVTIWDCVSLPTGKRRCSCSGSFHKSRRRMTVCESSTFGISFLLQTWTRTTFAPPPTSHSSSGYWCPDPYCASSSHTSTLHDEISSISGNMSREVCTAGTNSSLLCFS